MTGRKKRQARPTHLFVPIEEQRRLVQSATAYGIPQEEIALLIDNPETGKAVSPKTLRRAFKQEIKTGKTTMIVTVANALYRKAIGTGNQSVTAAIFILKTQAGWKDRMDVNLNLTDAFAEKLAKALARPRSPH